MSAPVAILVGFWATATIPCLFSLPQRPATGLGALWLLFGFAAILVAATHEGWPLGEWSQDTSPVAVFAAIALASVALKLLIAGGVNRMILRDGINPEAHSRARPWYLAAAACGGVAFALLGRSGAALLLAAVASAALFGVYRVAESR